jgi:hypothetical protein
MSTRSPAAASQETLRAVFAALLLMNAAAQGAGGAMMIANPQKLARETFGLSISAEAAPLVCAIGGAALSYALVSVAAAVGVLKRRAWASLVAVLLGGMLIAVGAVMLAHGMRVGAIDLAKGAVFVFGGLVHRPNPATTAPLVGQDSP